MMKYLVASFLVMLVVMTATLAVPEQRVNLNTAGADQLESLPGIGPTLAQRIIDFREQNGPFKRIEDLMNVRGIGEKKFRKLERKVTVGSESKRGGGRDRAAGAQQLVSVQPDCQPEIF